MTKAQLKEKYTKWNISITKEHEESTKYFKELQDLNFKNGSGSRWCDITNNLKGIFEKGSNSDIYKAMELVRKYHEAEGKHDALYELAIATKNFEIN